MEKKDDLNWDSFLPQNEQSADASTTIHNPSDDILSNSDIAALENWVQENSTMDVDALDGRQDTSQSPRIYRTRESLDALDSSMSFDDLALEMQLLKQTIHSESQALIDFSKSVDDAHAKVEEASAMVNTTLWRAARLKAVYNQLVQWSVEMQGAVTKEAHRSGLTVVDH